MVNAAKLLASNNLIKHPLELKLELRWYELFLLSLPVSILQFVWYYSLLRYHALKHKTKPKVLKTNTNFIIEK